MFPLIFAKKCRVTGTFIDLFLKYTFIKLGDVSSYEIKMAMTEKNLGLADTNRVCSGNGDQELFLYALNQNVKSIAGNYFILQNRRGGNYTSSNFMF